MIRYASAAASGSIIRRDRPLTNDEILRVAPSVFAQEAHESRGVSIPLISGHQSGPDAVAQLQNALQSQSL